MTNPPASKIAYVAFMLCLVLPTISYSQTFTTLVAFDGTNGYYVQGSPVQGLDGNFYGATMLGGTHRDGTLFQLTPGGSFTTLFTFCKTNTTVHCHAGSSPISGLVLAGNGSFYGTTERGGADDQGTIFEANPSGKLVTIYSFCSQTGCADGDDAAGTLIQGFDGELYGTTFGDPQRQFDTVFRVTLEGSFTTVYKGCCENVGAPLLQATDGNFYGTSLESGAYGKGAVFKITPGGALATLYSFCSQANCPDGAAPAYGLLEGTDGYLYGVTNLGGSSYAGTVFKISLSGALQTLHSFCQGNVYPNCPDGAYPDAPLIQASDGNIYGTAEDGGSNSCQIGDCGTVFKIVGGSSFVSVYELSGGVNATPAGITQGTDGNIYGSTQFGFGTLFRLSLGLDPLVRAVPAAARPGSTIKILGQGLTGTTAVQFNGIQADFKIESDTYLTATVPANATTGYITVTTSTGKLKTNTPFLLLP